MVHDHSSIEHLGSPLTLEEWRRALVAGDEASKTEVELGTVWHDLVRGHTSVAAHFAWDRRLYLLLSTSQEPVRPVLATRKLTAVESALAGGAVKVAALELGKSSSSLAVTARSVFFYMGVSCRLLQAPAILIIAAHAARLGAVPARSSISHGGGADFTVISVPRPELVVDGLLSPAERVVLRAFIDGMPHREIARARGTTPRTVANQLAAIFRKLGGSGRLDLIRRLVVLGCAEAKIKISA
jgi:DNA-binding CsgD family transcriptional regulator